VPRASQGLKPEKRQPNPTNRKSHRAKNGDCGDWDRNPDDLFTHIDPEKEAWRHVTAKADEVTGMQFPLSVRLVECAAGSMVLQTAANI